MNFLSHALIANQVSADSRWVLGAMLPDFFSMARLRVETVDDEMLRRGIDFHHRSDDVFHNAPIVVEVMDQATQELIEQGMAKGAAMAIGHVGLELLLDGFVVESGSAMSVYRSAIGELETVEQLVRFDGQTGDNPATRWRKFTEYLPLAPIPYRYGEPEFVAERLIRILANRPFLAVPTDKEQLVYRWVKEAASEIEQLTPTIFAYVEEGLTGVEYE